jgi:hypothetical protein
MSDQAPPQAAGEPHLDQDFAATLNPPTVDDADDMRGFYLRQRLARRSTRIWTAVGVAAGFLIGFGSLGIIFGLFGAAAALVIAFFLIWSKASSASEEQFFEAYAGQRDLALTEHDPLPKRTSLLRKGDERHTDQVLRGLLADGVDGTLALYTYTDVSYDKNGRHETDYRFTVALLDIPECASFVPELYCNRKVGFRFLEGVEDAFRSKERVRLESEAMEEHYEVFVTKEQDRNWIRQLFSPTFIVWLTEQAPDDFAFEIEDGTLCCNVKGYKKDAAQLDSMREAAAAVATRIRDEIRE